MEKLQGREICQYFLTIFILWNSFGSEMTIAGVRSQSSGSSYFVFQQSEYPKDCKEVLNACSSTQNTSGVYLIKPDGYLEAFEAYCDNSDLGNGGWTVLQRRLKESVNFKRTWKDFKTGFGFLGSEYWMGNEKIAFLTNQKQYQLRLEFENAAGESYYVIYDNFRISDEWGEYSLSSLGTYGGTAESHIEWCPSNKIFSNETCEKTCDDPETCISSASRIEKCVCVGNYLIQGENCIPQNQCGCYSADKRVVLMNGDSYINSDCTRRSNCSSNRLIVEDSYRCNDHASCVEKDGVRRCYCDEDYEGDGVTCIREEVPRDCNDLYVTGTNRDGVYTIYPDGWAGGIEVYCEIESNVGGWTILQRRSSASVDFYRTWNDYKNGFEHPSGDHWLGNDYIHAISNQKSYSLRIDLRDSSGSSYYALYSSFSISNEADKYRLSIGSATEKNTGYDAMVWHNNKPFSTRDQDNDGWSDFDCAEKHRGAWWFGEYYHCQASYSHCRDYCPRYEVNCDLFPVGSGCAICAYSHLNGDYDGSTRGTNIFWTNLNGYDCGLQYTEMKIRP